MNINFHQIRTHNHSQEDAFEELVCQLAHLEEIDNAQKFISKEGAGGDAGVECYWILNNGNEQCWQAKYFPDGMNSSRWSQITESFETALAKHPNLSTYYVALPLDRSDSRKVGRGGKRVKSVQDEWDSHVKTWQATAAKAGKTIEFVFWGKHEITMRLTKDDPRYSGRLLYWFNQPCLTTEKLKDIWEQSKLTLDERFTPEFHVDLPIADHIGALALDDNFWESWEKDLSSARKKLREFDEHFVDKEKPLLDPQLAKTFYTNAVAITDKIFDLIKRRQLLDTYDACPDEISELIEEEDTLQNTASEDFSDYEKSSPQREVLYDTIGYLETVRRRFSLSSTKIARQRMLLVHGEAGIGKSHLLCDISRKWLENGRPTIFLLGQHYMGGSPLDFLKAKLDLQKYSNGEVLGALDAAGEASATRSLIVVDAINEGPHRDDWYYQLTAFLSESCKFSNIAVLLSCRETFIRHVVPDSAAAVGLHFTRHQGFQGFEHRAASIYLSQQGIAKPSAPLLAPEFSNPLFLKITCKAIKEQGLMAFPTGLQGMVKVFNFYLSSLENAIARRKHYSPAEQLVSEALEKFVSEMAKVTSLGLQTSDARKLINEFDPNPTKGDSFFDELKSEGVISEDISYEDSVRGKPIYRVTYERFGDLLYAKALVEGYSKDNVKEIFDPKHPFGSKLDGGIYSIKGILEALSVVIAENFALELPDLLPEKFSFSEPRIQEVFAESLLWRSPQAISERSRELLNKLQYRRYDWRAIEILLKLSTIPNHPWNADFLHRWLLRHNLADRDEVWSTQIAFSDHEEDEGYEESILRTIIRWAQTGDVAGAEPERIRLCCVVLFWFFTTPNRIVRDQATKAAARLLSFFPRLIPDLLTAFSTANDPYVVERIFAATYGAVCTVTNKEILNKISIVVHSLVFEKHTFSPHILLRDYARGILEYVMAQSALPKSIAVESFRPPYTSEWPLHEPSEAEIKELAGDDVSSAIKSSLMGFPGDFGNYGMSCIHNWSITPLSEKEPATGHSLKVSFKEELPENIAKLYEKLLKEIEHENKTRSAKFEAFLANLDRNRDFEESVVDLDAAKPAKKPTIFDQVKAAIPEEHKEYYRWLSGLHDDRPAEFSRKLAQRWVCKRAYDLGWSDKKFGQFEKSCTHGRGSLTPSSMERMGKKYQWIALHELLARLSDNVHWIDRGYSDIDDKKYYGPWQMGKRDIDPTIWIKAMGDNNFHHEHNTWWQPYSFPLDAFQTEEEKKDYLWAEDNLPPFPEFLNVVNPGTGKTLTVLRGFWNQQQSSSDEDASAKLGAWFRINSIIIKKSDQMKLAKSLRGQRFIDPHTVTTPSSQHEGYWGEYPWHPYYQDVNDWLLPEDDFSKTFNVEHLLPVNQYEWERGGYDFSIDESMSAYLPAATLVNGLGLVRSDSILGAWNDPTGSEVFIDPSVSNTGPSYALMDFGTLTNWLNNNGLTLVWLIGGEKELISKSSHRIHGRLIFSGAYFLEKSNIQGHIWTEREAPYDY